MAQFTFYRFTKLISHVLFYLFWCELRLLICYWLRYCGELWLLVWGVSLLRKRQGTLSPWPLPPFKKRGRKLYALRDVDPTYCGFTAVSFVIFILSGFFCKNPWQRFPIVLYSKHHILKGGGQNVREYLKHIKLSLRHFYGKKNAARPRGLKF